MSFREPVSKPLVELAKNSDFLIVIIPSTPQTQKIVNRDVIEALGPNGQLIVNLVPELGIVIGKQPPVPDLPPQEAKNRFRMVFRRFLGVFARQEHPLALFLDDLQWLDTATLELLEQLITHSEVRHLLLVGAYRDNEVGPAHPLRRKPQLLHQVAIDTRIRPAQMLNDRNTRRMRQRLHHPRQPVLLIRKDLRFGQPHCYYRLIAILR